MLSINLTINLQQYLLRENVANYSKFKFVINSNLLDFFLNFTLNFTYKQNLPQKISFNTLLSTTFWCSWSYYAVWQ